jgi:hypothetical protein
MKKGVLILFFLIVPAVCAEISLTQGKNEYNLGDKITVSASLVEDMDFDGFFKVHLECPNYVMPYFVTPTSVEKGFRTGVNVPDLTATKEMMGRCKIKATLEGANGTIDTKYTDEFEVKNELKISCEAPEAIPSEEVEISCTARKISGELVGSGTAKVNYRRKELAEGIEAGMFSFRVGIGNDTPAGIQKIAVVAQDPKGNYGDLIFEVNVKAIPTKLENRVNKELFKPGETLEIRPVLYDHIGDLINTTISLEIATENKRLVSRDVVSGESVSYIFDSFALPGDYAIRSYAEGLTSERIVKVESLTKIEVEYSNEKAIVRNVGNVRYNDKTTILLENDKGEVFLIEKKLNLNPGESEEVDLSKEVPYGVYDIMLAEGSSDSEAVQEKLIENVEIHDNRPLYKKMGSSIKSNFNMVTGAAISTAGFISARPLFASIILAIIILCIILFYSKDFIVSKIGKVKVEKKEGIRIEEKDYEDVEGLFKDFKYGKE